MYKYNMCFFLFHPACLTSFVPDFVRRAYLHMDFQRVPIVYHPGHAALCVPEDRQPLHRQSGAIWCGQLHVCRHQHSHQEQRARTANPPSAAGRWYENTTLTEQNGDLLLSQFKF